MVCDTVVELQRVDEGQYCRYILHRRYDWSFLWKAWHLNPTDFRVGYCEYLALAEIFPVSLCYHTSHMILVVYSSCPVLLVVTLVCIR